MVDEFCFALLRSTTLQVLDAAGFDAAHMHTADTLADALRSYIHALASSVSAYAQQSGRSSGSVFDVVDAMQDMSISIDDLQSWFDKEGKLISPCWSEETDPGRIINDTINKGRTSHRYGLVYEYLPQDAEPPNMTNGDEHVEEVPVSAPPTSVQEQPHSPSSYIPTFFPPFPEPPKEEEEEDVTEAPLPQSTSAVPSATAPMAVRSRKRRVENPFTHLASFDESELAVQAEAEAVPDEQKEPDSFLHTARLPLSLSLLRHRKKEEISSDVETETPAKRSKHYNTLVKDVMDSLRLQHTTSSEKSVKLMDTSRFFQGLTQDEATAGNAIFSDHYGPLQQLVQRMAPPLSVSVLSSPNLLVDIGLPPQPPPSTEPPPPLSTALTKDTISPTTIKITTTVGEDKTTHTNRSPQTPISLASLAKAQKRKTPKKLTISLPTSNLSTATNTPSAGSGDRSSAAASTGSASTPKIRFTIKAPAAASAAQQELSLSHTPPPLQQASTLSMVSATPTSASHVSEEINCICTNPKIDYGAFMIACDRCGVWFHGNCVNKSEQDKVDDWICPRCSSSSSTLVPTPAPTPTTFPSMDTP